jgi:predicted amidophosphoribosyltransferase
MDQPDSANGGLRGVPAAAGFPGCRRCPYLQTGDPSICLECCVSRFPAPPPRRCPVCDQALPSPEPCANDWCGRADRWFSVVWSVGPHAGDWRRVLAGYKYRAETGWAPVLGRVLFGYLDEHMPWFDDYDLLVPMPAYGGPGARRHWDPVGEIVTMAAQSAGPSWDFASDLVVKDRETAALVGLSRPARRACAEGPLRRALRVPDSAAVAGGRLLVIDDVFTEGSTLREVARALVQAGAREVAGLTLARHPWQPAGPTREPGARA